MRLLLDTHTMFWWFMDEPYLSRSARAAIADAGNELLISACVGYEIAYKQRLGRLAPLPESLPRRLLREGIGILSISLDHALAAAELRGPHRDPWDRLMMAQARIEQCQMVTADPVFTDYGIPVLW